MNVLLTPFKMGLLLALTNAAVSSGQSPRTLYSFQGDSDGSGPNSTLIADSAGVLYGTTQYGGGTACGGLGCGTVFSWSPANGESVLYRFQGGADGTVPNGGLTLNANGILFGTTTWGGGSGCGGSGCGTAFALEPPTTPGSSWRYKQLYVFQGGEDGAGPTSYLLQGKAGVLFGVTSEGGGSACSDVGCGTFFTLVPPAIEGGAWIEKVLYRFQGGQDGSYPGFGLIRAGNQGSFYGVSGSGGGVGCQGDGCGTVFELIPPETSDEAWIEQTLYSFKGQAGNDGAYPGGGVPAVGPDGALYGVAGAGGSGCRTEFGCGVVYRLTPPANGSGGWREAVLYEFTPQSFEPRGKLISNGTNSLYGVTTAGFGTYGMVYSLSPPAIAGSGWTLTVLHSFTGGSDGGTPEGGLLTIGGVLYGTTFIGGPSSCQCGTIYSLTP